MITGKKIQEEFDTTKDFLSLIETYEEISAIRMRKAKKKVLSTREFMQGLNLAFGYISYAYKMYKKNTKKTTTHILNTNGKTLHILITANTGLYGDLIRQTYSVFSKDSRDKTTDVAIVGKMGRSLFESNNPGREYKYFDLSDSSTEDARLKNLVEYSLGYSNIIVYHGIFKSLLSQDVKITHLTGELLKIEETVKDTEVRFMFEPSIEDIAEYFEKQILSLLLEQTVLESYLGKFASRMVSLDSSADNIHKRLDELDFSLKKFKHKDINAGIKANLTGVMLCQ